MPAISISNDQLLAPFIDRIDDFAGSQLVAAGQYDTAKLAGILREKEIFSVCKTTQAQLDLVNQIDTGFGKVVKELVAARHLDASYEEYLEMERHIEEVVQGDLYIFSRQVALSVKALYFYKKGAFDKAISATLECIVMNEYLIRQGMGTLNLRCFEQNKNISRTLMRQGKTEEGYCLIFNLLNFLLTGVSRGLHGSLFADENYWNIVPVLREAYASELFSMFSEDMIKFNSGNKTDFLPNCWYMDLDFEVTTPARQIIYNWIYINKQLSEGNYGEYIDSMTYFFEQPMSASYDVMKMSLLVDFMKVTRRYMPEEGDRVKEKISGFILDKMKWNERVRRYVVEHAL